MKKLSKEELWKIMEDAFEEAKIKICGLKYDYDITQDEFDERLYQLNLAEQQLRKLIEEKPKVTRKFVKQWSDIVFGEHGFPEYGTLEQMLKEAGVEVEK